VSSRRWQDHISGVLDEQPIGSFRLRDQLVLPLKLLGENAIPLIGFRLGGDVSDLGD